MKLAASSIDVRTTPIVTFSNWLEYADTVTRYPTFPGATSRSGEAWIGKTTWEQAVEYAYNGEAARTTMLTAHVDKLMEIAPKLEVPEMYLDVTTDYGWDMGTAITGNPQAGINFHMVEGESRKQISLVVSCNNTSDITPEQMQYRGVLAYYIYLLLTNQGYAVTINVAATSEAYHDRNISHTVNVPLLSPGESIDLAVLAYAITNPSVFRRLMFAYRETIFNADSRKVYSVQADGGYGFSINVPKAMQGDIYLSPSVMGNLSTEYDYTRLITHATQLIEEFQAKG